MPGVIALSYWFGDTNCNLVLRMVSLLLVEYQATLRWDIITLSEYESEYEYRFK